jgi:hypothetical protein
MKPVDPVIAIVRGLFFYLLYNEYRYLVSRSYDGIGIFLLDF